MSWSKPTISRRVAVVAIGGALLSACSGDGESPAQPSPQPSAEPAGSPPATTLPKTAPYAVVRAEVEPGCKEAAVQAVTAALTWQPGEQARALPDRLIRAGAMPSLASDLDGLVDDHLASSLEIVYPQYGGLSNGRQDASVILVVRQTWRTVAGAELRARDLTLDVRLRKNGRRWTAERAAVPTLPRAAARLDVDTQRLLRKDALVLPTAARADLAAGIIDERIVRLLGALSQKWRIHVQVLKSGHPKNVYGTTRVSNHTRGRAVDVWAIDDVPVIEQRESVWSAVMREAARVGADEIGGPADLDRRAGQPPYFTDDVHQDHLHMGFEDP